MNELPALYPLKFRTIFKEKIWGGQKIKSQLGKDFSPLKNCGETWELSAIDGNISKVANGTLKNTPLDRLIQEYKGQLLGSSVHHFFKGEFPLLIKFIDANQDLSIQVHPDDRLAQERHQCLGKTEMWYILQADEGASLISGFNQPANEQLYLEHLESGRLQDLLNREKVEKDDVFFIPAGRVHTIGKGCFLAEIQQSSDITYRIYDFDRTDAKGNKRELHTEKALAAIDYTHYSRYKTNYTPRLNQAVPLARCKYFETNVLHFNESTIRNYGFYDSFIILIGLEGEAYINAENAPTERIGMGEVVLIPACFQRVELQTSSSFKLLETYVPMS